MPTPGPAPPAMDKSKSRDRSRGRGTNDKADRSSTTDMTDRFSNLLRGASSTRRSGPQLSLHVSGRGTVIMPHPILDAINGHPNTELSGELEIELPKGSGKKRCRSISVGLKSVSRLFMGPERGWEEDVLFDRKIDLRGAIVLEEGTQRFGWNIIIPFHLGPHDFHPKGNVILTIYAEVDGLPSKTSSGWFTPRSSSPDGERDHTHSHSRSRTRKSSTQISPAHSGSTTPTGNAPGSSGMLPHSWAQDISEPPQDRGIAHQMLVSWREPIDAHSEGKVDWLYGTHTCDRRLWLIYNPNIEGEVNKLDLTAKVDLPSVGVVNVRWTSHLWTVCATLNTLVSVTCVPTAQIYFVAVVLTQKALIRSPRELPETPPLEQTRRFVIWTSGKRPEQGEPLTASTPTLWKGAGELVLKGTHKLPDHTKLRPSTVEGVMTPIQVTHTLSVELWFALDGELQMLVAKKDVDVPSCDLIPKIIALPSYGTSPLDPCPLCGLPPNEQFCVTCPRSIVPHARHDLSPSITKSSERTCRLCLERINERFASTAADTLQDVSGCACGLPPDTGENELLDAAMEQAEETQRGRSKRVEAGRAVEM